VRVDRPAVRVGDLDLINASEVDAAVLALADVYLDLEIEVLELGDGAEVAIVEVPAFRWTGLLMRSPFSTDQPFLAPGLVNFQPSRLLPSNRAIGAHELDLGQVGPGRQGRDPLAGEFPLLEADPLVCGWIWVNSMASP
jgi:hypothetical protein